MVHCNTTSCMVYCNSFPKLDGRSSFSILKLHFGGVILKRVISWNSWVLTFNAGISWVAWQARWAARITLVSRGILTKMRHQDCWDSINAEPRTKPTLELSWIKNVSLSVSIYSVYIYICIYIYTYVCIDTHDIDIFIYIYIYLFQTLRWSQSSWHVDDPHLHAQAVFLTLGACCVTLCLTGIAPERSG